MPESRLEIIWAPRSRRDLIDIWAYFADVASPDVADKLLRDIHEAAQRLRRHPMMGRPRDNIAPSLRSVLVRPYAILYRAKQANIEIVRVLHVRRDLAAAFAESE